MSLKGSFRRTANCRSVLESVHKQYVHNAFGKISDANARYYVVPSDKMSKINVHRWISPPRLNSAERDVSVDI